MGTMTLTGGAVLTYTSETWGTAPAAAYSAWCASLGVSDTGTDVAIDDDDAAFAFTLQTPFFSTGYGDVFYSTEAGIGLFLVYDPSGPSGIGGIGVQYTGIELPRFFGRQKQPQLLITYHPGYDLKSYNGKVRKSGTTTLIFAQHSHYNNEAISRYDVAIKITAQSIEIIGATTDVATDVKLFELTEGALPSGTQVQQATIQAQALGTTYRYTVTTGAAPDPTGIISADSPLGAFRGVGNVIFTGNIGIVSANGPLKNPRATGLHDFTRFVSGALVNRYVMDLTTPSGTVRVPISSWQATLRTGASSYVQCVIPAAQQWGAAINAATSFRILRRAVTASGQVIEYMMAESPADTPQFDRGPTNHTCTLSGYAPGFAEQDVSPGTDRTLTGIRSISSGASYRVRCAVDWLLRPGQRGVVDGVPFVVEWINYYVNTTDAYMEAGT